MYYQDKQSKIASIHEIERKSSIPQFQYIEKFSQKKMEKQKKKKENPLY